jgi:hypothetical protein
MAEALALMILPLELASGHARAKAFRFGIFPIAREPAQMVNKLFQKRFFCFGANLCGGFAQWFTASPFCGST